MERWQTRRIEELTTHIMRELNRMEPEAEFQRQAVIRLAEEFGITLQELERD